MTEALSDPAHSDLGSPARLAGRRFAQTLAWTQLIAVTARVEATLHAAGSLEDLFALEAGLGAAFPDRPPVCELMWAGETSDVEPSGLRLAAFDDAGRVLLRKSYLVGEAGPFPDRMDSSDPDKKGPPETLGARPGGGTGDHFRLTGSRRAG